MHQLNEGILCVGSHVSFLDILHRAVSSFIACCMGSVFLYDG